MRLQRRETCEECPVGKPKPLCSYATILKLMASLSYRRVMASPALGLPPDPRRIVCIELAWYILDMPTGTDKVSAPRPPPTRRHPCVQLCACTAPPAATDARMLFGGGPAKKHTVLRDLRCLPPALLLRASSRSSTRVLEDSLATVNAFGARTSEDPIRAPRQRVPGIPLLIYACTFRRLRYSIC